MIGYGIGNIRLDTANPTTPVVEYDTPGGNTERVDANEFLTFARRCGMALDAIREDLPLHCPSYQVIEKP